MEQKHHSVCDREVFKTYETTLKAAVNICLGVGTVFGQGELFFQLDFGTMSLTCYHVPDFK